MYEREPQQPKEQRFWQTERTIGRIAVANVLTELYLRSRSVSEPYRPGRRREIVPVSRSGERTYTLSQAYILVPAWRSLEQGSQRPDQGLTTQPGPPEDVRVGDVQSFFYAADHTLVIWDGLMLPDHRGEDPVTDSKLQTLWSGAEQFLLGHFDGVERMVTPSWEPVYETAAYRAFLESMDYRRISALAFEKRVATTPDGFSRQHQFSTANKDQSTVKQERR